MRKLLLIIIVSVFAVGCQQEYSDIFFEYDNKNKDTVWYEALPANALSRTFPAKFGKPENNVTISNITGGIANFNDSVYVTVPAEAFVIRGGSVVNDNVVLSVTHLSSKGDIIKNSKPTESYDNILITGGAFRIKAKTLAGTDLELGAGKSLSISMKNRFSLAAVTGMSIFYGNENAYSSNVLQQFTWNSSSDTVNFIPSQGGISVGGSYQFNLDSLNWINVDKFYNASSVTKTIVTMPSDYTNTNTAVYMVFKNINSVLQCNSDAANRYFYKNGIPVGQAVRFVSVSEIDGQFYLGLADANIVSGHILNLVPQPKTQQEVIAALDAL